MDKTLPSLKEELAGQLSRSKDLGGKSSLTLISAARNQPEMKDRLISQYNSQLEEAGREGRNAGNILNRDISQRRMLLKNQSNFSSVSSIQLLGKN